MSAIPKRRLSEGAEFRAKPVETGDPHDKDEMKLAHRMEKSSTKRVNVGGQVSAVAGLVSDDDFGIASDNKKLKPSPFSHQLSTSSTFGKGDGDGFGSTMMPEASNKILKTEAVHESGVEALLDSKEVVQTSTEFLEFEFDPEKAALILPTNPAECNSYLCAQSRIVVRNTAQKLKQTNGKIPRTLTKDENTLLIVIVSAICNLEHLSKKLVKDMYLKLCLEVLLSPEFAFSAFVRHLASEAYQKYEGQNWGEEAKADLEPENEIITNRNLHGAKKTISKTLSKSKEQHVRKPAATHPIYGANGICRGILIDTSGKAKSYLFDDAYTRRSAKPFGHNGITNGDVWPMLMCALRDGAHGAKMKGIAGTAVNGATSIVISAGYDGMDEDDGDDVLYSGSGAHDNTDPDEPKKNNDTEALRKSYLEKTPIRVIRSWRGRSKWAPSAGYRYDGLYTISQAFQPKNDKGGRYVRFKLTRNEGQAAIDTARPTREEKLLFERAHRGY